MARLIIAFIFCIFGLNVFSQNPVPSQDSEPRPYLKQEGVISQLASIHKQLNQRQGGMDGFRIQIYTDSGNRSKLRTERIEAEFNNRFPQIKSYITYDEPYYRLRVGDFRTRIEAQRFLNQIASMYLDAFIVVGRINFPELRYPEVEMPSQE